MNPISGHTRIVCVIGDPVSHSLSPAMHNAAFRHLGLDFAYVAFHVTPPQLKVAVSGFRALQIAGVNVTVPHKQAILPLLDSVGATARRVGAVNTIVNTNGRLHGENTDVFGFQRALEDAGVQLRGARVVLIGAGGAARAVLVALDDAGAAEVRIFNRTARRALDLARSVGRRDVTTQKVPRATTTRGRVRNIEASALRTLRGGPMKVTTAKLDALPRADLASVDVVVNTTSIGLRGERFPRLLYASAAKNALFFDLVPRVDTPFLQATRAARRRPLDGTGMLLHQGAAALELWTDQPAPVDVMRRALRSAQRS